MVLLLFFLGFHPVQVFLQHQSDKVGYGPVFPLGLGFQPSLELAGGTETNLSISFHGNHLRFCYSLYSIV